MNFNARSVSPVGPQVSMENGPFLVFIVGNFIMFMIAIVCRDVIKAMSFTLRIGSISQMPFTHVSRSVTGTPQYRGKRLLILKKLILIIDTAIGMRVFFPSITGRERERKWDMRKKHYPKTIPLSASASRCGVEIILLPLQPTALYRCWVAENEYYIGTIHAFAFSTGHCVIKICHILKAISFHKTFAVLM